jgi:hypothetical protein
MKKYTPYILPLIVIAVVFILVFRWYNMRNDRMTSSLLEEGVVIENLSEEELQETLDEAGDYETVQLQPVAPAAEEEESMSDPETTDEGDKVELSETGQGVIRYDIQDDRVRFSVIGTFPESSEPYQAFLRDVDGTVTRHAFTLEERKGGLVGSAAISVDVLPVEVIIARGGTQEPGEIVLMGKLEAPATE